MRIRLLTSFTRFDRIFNLLNEEFHQLHWKAGFAQFHENGTASVPATEKKYVNSGKNKIVIIIIEIITILFQLRYYK